MAKYAFLVHICIFEKNWACLVLTPIFMLMLPTLCFVLLYLIFPIYYVLHFDCVFTGVDARIHVDAAHIDSTGKSEPRRKNGPKPQHFVYNPPVAKIFTFC